MQRFLMIGAVLTTAMLCDSSETSACERLARRVGAVATAPLRLLKAVHQRRQAKGVENSTYDATVSIEISVVE